MMRRYLYFIGVLIALCGGISIFNKMYFGENAIFQRKIKIWNDRTKYLKSSKSGKIEFENGINLRWTISNFLPEDHTIERCENIDANYICKIDGKDWYGSDFKMDLPQNELKKLSVFVNGRYIDIDVSQMFNPNQSGELNRDQFKIQQNGNILYLFGFFSDGAGTYTAKWKIFGNKSKREIISTDDADFSWQIDN